MSRFIFALLALIAGPVFGQNTFTVTEGPWSLYSGASKLADYATRSECHQAANAREVAEGATVRYGCRTIDSVLVTRPAVVVCELAPAASSATTSAACPSGQTGGPIVTTTTTTFTRGPAPACELTSAVTTAVEGACTPVATAGPALYFSDCQEGAAAGCVPGSNANPGTEAAPKQNLSGVNVNALPAGASLLFKRGGAWANVGLMLDNPNTSAAAPLVFDAYGTGPAPLFRRTSGNAFNIGGGWGNTTNDGGYVIRNLKLDGMGTSEWAIWFVQNVRDVTIENTEITGYRIAINSNDGAPYGVSGITLRNNHIHRNRAMGLLGHYDNMLIEGNLFEANNFSGSTFDHGTYIGGGRNITLRGNRYVRNSVVNGTCTGGNMTFHGRIDGLLIEGNTIEQDAAAQSCWLMAITQGYSTAEGFTNAVVRNNLLKNGGQGIVAQSAPGIVVEDNVVIDTNINIGSGSTPGADGDLGDVNAVVRNNTLCARSSTHTVAVNSPGATVAGNVTRTGADASAGICAR